MEERMESMENTDLMETCDVELEESGSGSGIFGKVVLGTVIAGIAGAVGYAVTHKNEIKAKRMEKKAAQLEAAGYIVARPEDVEYEEAVDEELIVETEETE